jgi:hypothetical protein
MVPFRKYFSKERWFLFLIGFILIKIIYDYSAINKNENRIKFKKEKRSTYEVVYIEKDKNKQPKLNAQQIQEKIYKEYDRIEEDKSGHEKYVMWSCETSCGGWGDRMKAITSSFMLSVLLKRRFRLKVKHPCDFEVMFQGSNKYFWQDPLASDVNLINHNTLTLGFNIIVRNVSLLFICFIALLLICLKKKRIF